MRLHPTLCFITHLLRGYSAPGSPARGRGRGSSRRGRARWPPKAELRPAVPGLQQRRAQGTNSAPLKIAAPGLLLSRGHPAGSGPLPQRGTMCGEALRARCLPRGCQPCLVPSSSWRNPSCSPPRTGHLGRGERVQEEPGCRTEGLPQALRGSPCPVFYFGRCRAGPGSKGRRLHRVSASPDGGPGQRKFCPAENGARGRSGAGHAAL